MRIFAGDFVKSMMERLGMKEGEAIESRVVTNRIASAQKKVEERNYEIRKSLLDYDEVMDEQRKRVYSYRQSLLHGANCRDRILRSERGARRRSRPKRAASKPGSRAASSSTHALTAAGDICPSASSSAACAASKPPCCAAESATSAAA